MPAYDVHQHLWPEAFVRALERRREPPRLRGNVLELTGEGTFEIDLGVHELDRRLALLDRDGIDVAVVSLPPTLEAEAQDELREAYHEGIRELVEASGGRLVALAAGESREGFAGACISAGALVGGLGSSHHPTPAAGSPTTPPRALPGAAPPGATPLESLVADLESSDGVLFVHPGPPASLPTGAPAWWAAVVDYTAQMQAAYAAWIARDAARHPRLPVIFAILAGGGPFQVERFASRDLEVSSALHSNVYFESASYGRRALELSVATFGVSQLLYGSDSPVIDSASTLAAVRSFGGAIADRLLSENPANLFR